MFGPEAKFLLASLDCPEARVIEQTLCANGFLNVIRVTDGLIAIRLVKKSGDYVLMANWDLPGLTGVGLINEVRHIKRSKKMPCILFGQPRTREEIKLAGEIRVNAIWKDDLSAPKIMSTISRLTIMDPEQEAWPLELLEQADRMLEDGRIKDSIDRNHMVIRQVKKRVGALQTEMGIVLYKQGKFKEAVESLGEAIINNPGLPRAHAALGKACFQLGRHEEAGQALNNALELDPQNSEVQVYLAESSLQCGQNSKAEELFRELLKNNPEDPFYLNRLAIALRLQGKYQQAIEVYQDALIANCQDENMLFNLGRCYFEAGRHEEAIDSLNNALKIRPDFKEAKLLIGKINKLGT